MLAGPLLVRYNGRVADFILRRRTVQPSEVALETAATRELAERKHVIICGFGRVGQNLARVLESRGLEFIALDLDPYRVRDARQAGDPVVYGDASGAGVLQALGSSMRARWSCPSTTRRLRSGSCAARRSSDLPCWCAPRTRKLDQLQAAGATEVTRHVRDEPVAGRPRVALPEGPPQEFQTTEDIRHDRYSILRSVFRKARLAARRGPRLRQQLRTVVLPPERASAARSASSGCTRGKVLVNAVRRDGIVGRIRTRDAVREGDAVVLWGAPETSKQSREPAADGLTHAIYTATDRA
jgi:CPA2 family monovalent cation:H+ antiporter-2